MTRMMKLRSYIPNLLAIAAFLLLTIFISPQHASAAGAGPQTPKAYKSVSADGSSNPYDTEFKCEFRNSAEVLCWKTTLTGKNQKAYHFDPALSEKASHDVFRPDSDQSSAADYGYLHFPNSTSGDYSLGQVSTSKTDGSKGVIDNDVDTSSIKTSADSGVCSIELFSDGKKHTCIVGNSRVSGPGIGAQATSTYKTGFAEVDSFQEANKSCDNGGLGFILCPIKNLLSSAMDKLSSWLTDILDINTNSFRNPDFVAANQRLLNLANAFYVLIFLVIIFANSFSIGLDSYALKKMVPRLVAAIILSQFAYLIAGAIIEVGNILGAGVQGFFSTLGASGANGGAAQLTTAIASVGAIFLVLCMIVIAIVALIVVLGILAIRMAMLYVLVLVAPLAFAAKVLPNTEKLFKTWWTNLIKLVMMYPIIMAIIYGSAALGNIMKADSNGAVVQIIGALLPFIGFLMVPKAFKWSGGIMAATGGKLSDWAAGKTKSAAKDTWSKEGGLKDRAASKGVPTSLGAVPTMISARKRLETVGAAQDRRQKAAETGAGQAERIVRAMPAGDNSPTATQEEKDQYKARAEKVQSLLKTLKTPEAQSKFVASLAKSGNRTDVETARSSGVMNDATWETMTRSNFDDFKGMADLREKPTTAATKYPEFLQKLTAEGFVEGNGYSQPQWAKDGAFGLMDAQQFSLLGDQGIRSKIKPKALTELSNYRAQLQAKAAYAPGGLVGPGVRTQDEEKKLRSLTWLP